MGVKSTVRLTREQALNRYVEMKLDQKRAKIRAKAEELSDTELEDRLEALNDARYEDGMGGFDNYSITEHPEE